MASIVYDGLPGNGDLFLGMKFFIALRVPMRNTLVNNVESNGGEVKPLEKQADMIIADHARAKLAPDGSFSWKYIEDSVKNGELQDKEKYRIHAANPSGANPTARTTGTVVGGSRPNKATRTPYTPEDDKFLLRWVAKAVQRGMSPLGNLIYKQLEKENPRHPWQSWLDRYKQKYRDKPLPDVTNDDGPGPVDEAVRHQYSRPQVARQVDDVDDELGPVTGTVRRQPPRPQQVSHQGEGREDDHNNDEDEEGPSQGGPDIVERLARHAPEIVEYQEFNEEDDDLLISEYDAILNIEREGTSVIKAWSAFAKGHGRHTGDEWYHYFHTVIKPLMKKKLQKASKAKKPRPRVVTSDDDEEEEVEEQRGLGKQLSKSADFKKLKPNVVATEDYEMREDAWNIMTEEKMQAEKVIREHGIQNARGSSIFAESDRDTDDDQEADADQDMGGIDYHLSQNPADEVPAPVLRSKSPNVSPVPKASAFRKPSSTRKQHKVATNDNQDEFVSEEKAAFLEDLRTIARATHKQIEPRQEVCGIHIQLYDLWNAVNNKFDGFEDVDAGDMWGQVATHLCFNISKHPDLSKELRNLYNTFLVKVEGSENTRSTVKPKATAINSRPETIKQQRTVAKEPGIKPGIPSASRPTVPSRTMGSQLQAKKTAPASSRGTPKLPQPQKIARRDSLTVNGNASIHLRALPDRPAQTAPSKKTVPASEVPMNDLGATASQPFPMQLKTATDYMKTSTGHLEGVDDEGFTEADLVMLAKLVDFARECLDIPIQRTGSPICGRWVSLPKFRKVVNALGGYNTVTRKKLWKQVSLDLGYFPTNKYTSVPDELQEAYEEVLMDYDEYRKKVRNLRESLGAQELQALGDEDSAVPHTSIRQAGSASSQKRARNASKYDNPANVPDTFKRRRADRKGKGKEIQAEVPGTPEHIYNSSMLSQEASVVKDSQIIELSSDLDSDVTEAYQPIKKPVFHKAAAAEAPTVADEPETQEFSFVDLEEESPSRQLNSEAMASMPVSPAIQTRKRAASPFVEDDEVKPGGSDIQEYYAMCDTEGYTFQVAARTLAAANMNPGLAKKILNRVARGQPIPENIKGIWTSRDDDVLTMDLPVDHPDMVKLRRKHGAEEIEDRMQFLESLGEGAEDEDEQMYQRA